MPSIKFDTHFYIFSGITPENLYIKLAEQILEQKKCRLQKIGQVFAVEIQESVLFQRILNNNLLFYLI